MTLTKTFPGSLLGLQVGVFEGKVHYKNTKQQSNLKETGVYIRPKLGVWATLLGEQSLAALSS